MPSHYVNTLLRAARKHGLDTEQVLRGARIDSALIAGDRTRVSSASFRQLTKYLIVELQDENAGLLAHRTKCGTFAMMCYAAIGCPTLGQFLQRCTEFNALVNEDVSLKLERDGEQARYSLTPLPGAVDDDELIIMILLGITHRLSNWAIGQTITLDRVNITREQPGYAHEYNFLFMAPVHFGQKVNSLSFAANYLDMPIAQTGLELDQFLSTPTIHLMTSHDSGRSLTSKIRAMIREDVAGNFPEFSTIAETLHMATATLRRKLRSEGSSYQQLKDDIRRDTAIYYLGRGTISIDEVAELVGFSEPTSFFRAFKRWTGVTPRAYISKPATTE